MSVLSVENQLFELTPSEERALNELVERNSEGVQVIKKIIEFHAEKLNSVLNIDEKGNMGLQALSRQYSLRFLQDVFKELFPVKLSIVQRKTTKWQ